MTSKLAPLEAERLRSMVTASISPHLDEHVRKELLDGLSDQVEPLQPIRPQLMVPAEEDRDPEKARQWFQAQGIRVVPAG